MGKLKASLIALIVVFSLDALMARSAITHSVPDLTAIDQSETLFVSDGDIIAGGAFTCDLTVAGSELIDPLFPAIIERDRMFMAEQAGMFHKHIPLRIDPATGNLLAVFEQPPLVFFRRLLTFAANDHL